LHLVGILFPHINDDARSKSHQKRNSNPSVSTRSTRSRTENVKYLN